MPKYHCHVYKIMGFHEVVVDAENVIMAEQASLNIIKDYSKNSEVLRFSDKEFIVEVYEKIETKISKEKQVNKGLRGRLEL